MAQEIVDRGPLINQAPPPIVYDPTDGDELAEAERRRKQQQNDDDPPGGIGR